MEILKAENYKTREDIEKDVISKFGQTTEKKDAQIQGTKKELRNLQLSKDTTVWGVSVVEVDSKEEKVVSNDKVDRGEIYKSGINLH